MDLVLFAVYFGRDCGPPLGRFLLRGGGLTETVPEYDRAGAESMEP